MVTKEVALVALFILGSLGLSWVIIWLYNSYNKIPYAKKGEMKDAKLQQEDNPTDGL